MLIPAAAIWRHASCCLCSVTPNPTVPLPLSSLPVSRWERHTPEATCAAVFTLWMFVRAHQGAYCASIFTARISDKLNESPESSYLPAHSCSVLSSLFSDSVFCLLVFFSHILPACCLSAYTNASSLSKVGFCLNQRTSFLRLFWVHIPISSQSSKYSEADFALHHVD